MIRRIADKTRRKATEKRQATARSQGEPIDTDDAVMEETTLRIYRVHYSEYSICPRCESPNERESGNYCCNCGQRLSWESYMKGDIETEYCPPLYQNEAVIAEESSLEMCMAAK